MSCSCGIAVFKAVTLAAEAEGFITAQMDVAFRNDQAVAVVKFELHFVVNIDSAYCINDIDQGREVDSAVIIDVVVIEIA